MRQTVVARLRCCLALTPVLCCRSDRSFADRLFTSLSTKVECWEPPQPTEDGRADLLLNDTGLDFPVSPPLLPSLSHRDELVEQLSNEVFARGNVHLKNAETLTSLPEGFQSSPEVCFIGKPNTGKSTLVSCLLHNRRLGKAGSTPGTTRLLQFFSVGGALLLVDTPGYGGWKGRQLSQKASERANAFSILFRYLALRKGGNLKRVYWLMEASVTQSVSIQRRDEEILAFLQRERIPFSLILTKIDRHWRHYKEMSRRGAIVGKDGIVIPGHTDTRTRVASPEEGIQRNIDEVCDFLGTRDIPILGVCADRRTPTRCKNLVALQHDIVHYCTQDLKQDEDLCLRAFQELSYAPPTAEDIQRVQLKYPVEAFVVPQNNNESLEHMVRKHLEARSRFVAGHASCDFLSAKDAHDLHLPSSTEGGETSHVDPLIVAQATPVLSIEDGDDGVTMTQKHSLQIEGGVHSASAVITSIQLASSYPPPPPLVPVEGAVRQEDISCSVEPASLPLALDANTHSVVAINGVRIPRTMVSASLENLAIFKEDELPAFALKSGAGAYEELLMTDHLRQDAATPELFMQHSPFARLSEQEDERLNGAYHSKSMVRDQKEKLLSKYIDKERKERSIYMQAEGYMCPWLAGAGQSRSTVVGLPGMQAPKGRSGTLLKGLKQRGFGGRSLSARTVKNRGRATKKTGSWAA